jgi:hypothetical protein
VPSDIANLAVWVRSDTGVYQDAAKSDPATNGATVYTWDNMGNTVLTADFVQATANNRPIYSTSGGLNSKPRVQYFGTNFMRCVSGTFAQPYTVVVIGKFTGDSTLDTWVAGDDGAYLNYQTVATAKMTAYDGGFITAQIPFSQGIVITDVVRSGDFVTQLIINQMDSGDASFIGFGGINTAVRIGADNTPANWLLVFSRGLKAFELCQLNLYAKSYYGLTY